MKISKGWCVRNNFHTWCNFLTKSDEAYRVVYLPSSHATRLHKLLSCGDCLSCQRWAYGISSKETEAYALYLYLLNLVWLCGLSYLLSFGRSANMIFAHHHLIYDPWIVNFIVRPTFLMGSQVRLLALYLASRNNFLLLDYMMFFSHRYKDLNMICVFSHQLCRSNPHSSVFLEYVILIKIHMPTIYRQVGQGNIKLTCYSEYTIYQFLKHIFW